jgi:hypothetical protein
MRTANENESPAAEANRRHKARVMAACVLMGVDPRSAAQIRIMAAQFVTLPQYAQTLAVGAGFEDGCSNATIGRLVTELLNEADAVDQHKPAESGRQLKAVGA